MEHDFTQPVADIATVPSQFRSLYEATEQDGKQIHVLKKDDVTKGAVEAIVGLNTALKASRAEAKANKGKTIDLTPLKDYGSTPEEIAQAIDDKIKALSAKGGEDVERQIRKIKEDLAKGHATDLDGKNKRIDALTKQLYTHLVTSAATTAIAAEKGIPELLLPFVQNQVRVDEKDGQIQVFVVDGAGDPRYSGTTGKPMSVAELVKEMKSNAAYGRLFDSDAPTGGGKPPVGGPTKPGQKAEDMSPTDKIAAGLKKGQASRKER